MQRILLILFLGLCVCSCAPSRHSSLSADGSGGSNTGNVKTGEAARIVFRSYRGGGLNLGLMNESHTDRLEYYSTARDQTTAGYKVASDEIVLATIAFMIEEGFDEHSRPGPAPSASARNVQALELLTNKGTRHIAFGANSSKSEQQVFKTCVEAFTGVYNNVYGAQSVNNDGGAGLFQRPTKRRGR